MREERQLPRARLSFSDGATDQLRLRGMGTLVVRLQPVFQLRDRAGQFLSEIPEGISVAGVSGGVFRYAINEVMCLHRVYIFDESSTISEKKESERPQSAGAQMGFVSSKSRASAKRPSASLVRGIGHGCLYLLIGQLFL